MKQDIGQVVVIGASAGGVEATTRLVRRLPSGIKAPVLIAVHMSSNAPSALPGILSRAGDLEARHPADGEPMRNGVIYVAPPDHHLLVEGDVVRVVRGPRENGHRPAIDPLFRSAARHYGTRAVGVVLSGVLDDGSAGLCVLKQAGGVAVVQDPDDALYQPMPRNAMQATEVDHVAPALDIGPLLAKVVDELDSRGLERNAVADEKLDVELSLITMETDDPSEGEGLAPPSPFSCPDCQGVLNEVSAAGLPGYRCRVGHAWAAESLLAAQTMHLETALWMALRSLEEKVSLARRLAARARGNDSPHSEQRFSAQAHDAQAGADAIRSLLAHTGALAQPAGDAAVSGG